MSNDKTMRTIRALLARAEHPNTPAAEAELSRDRAMRMMLKASISEAEVNASRKETAHKPGAMEFSLLNPYAKQKWILLESVARQFNCRTIRTNDLDIDGDQVYYMYGYEADIDIAWTLFISLLNQMQAAMPRGDRSYKISYMTGYTLIIHRRLQDFYAAEVAEAGQSTALVLRDRSDEVDKFFRSRHSQVRTQRGSKIRDAQGYFNGQADGQRADISVAGRNVDRQDVAITG